MFHFKRPFGQNSTGEQLSPERAKSAVIAVSLLGFHAPKVKAPKPNRSKPEKLKPERLKPKTGDRP
jgi:hypothetical protein